ncbi:MAG: hypothetical protein QM758_11625 [Armatimonas sp.]
MSTTPPAFDLEDDTPPRRPSSPPAFDITPDPPASTPLATPQGARVRGVGCLSAVPVLLLLLKLGSVSKFFLPLISFFASVWFYMKVIPGAPILLPIGIFLMIFLHECGHALAARRFGLKYQGMIFTPFGGIVFHRPGNTNVVQDAFIGIMGPVTGGLCGVVAALIAYFTGNKLFWLLGSLYFAINMANLVPGGPLDGGWIGAVFSNKLSPRCESLIREGKVATYFCATPTDRTKYGFAWGGLALFLLIGTGLCRHFLLLR